MEGTRSIVAKSFGATPRAWDMAGERGELVCDVEDRDGRVGGGKGKVHTLHFGCHECKRERPDKDGQENVDDLPCIRLTAINERRAKRE